jgi:putative ubiquitin-RnfH superfamily antitoxin RatB of RatAB toxin-antitoxin module
MEIEIEVVFGDRESQRLQRLKVAAGTTARQAVELMLADETTQQWANAPIGVFGKKVRDDYVLQPHDRVEIYRPLLIDPKEARRLRAAKKVAEKAADSSQ